MSQFRMFPHVDDCTWSCAYRQIYSPTIIEPPHTIDHEYGPKINSMHRDRDQSKDQKRADASWRITSRVERLWRGRTPVRKKAGKAEK